NPDLEKVHGLGFRGVEFAVNYSGSSGHRLDYVRPEDMVFAGAVLMLQPAGKNVGDDFHVAVRVSAESAAGSNLVVVQNPQGTESHVLGVVVPRERKGVIRVQPAMLGVAALIGAADGHRHCL